MKHKFQVGDEVLIVHYNRNDWIKEQLEKDLEVKGIIVKSNFGSYSVQLPEECTWGHTCGGVIPAEYVGWYFPEVYLAPYVPLPIMEEIE